MGTLLNGRSAVVTGAGGGIGREISLALAAEGAKVVVNDPGASRAGVGGDVAPADAVVNEIKKRGGQAVANYNSVSDFKAAEKIVKSCVDSFGRIDILVNCAGILREKMIYNMPEEDWDIVLGVHLKGTFNTSRHASGLMKEQKFGRIINVTSSAWLGTIGQANYGAAKGGIVSFTRALALELGRYGVTANCICPLAATRMTMTDEVKEGWKKRLAQGAITQQKYEELLDMPGPEYIPPAAIFLASDAAANVNGAVIGITGGKVAIYSDPVEIRGIYRDWKKDGAWTAQEIIKLAPTSLLVGYVNPAPAEKAK